MKGLSKYFLIQCFLCITLSINAHSPDLSSTLLVEESEAKWILQVRAALTAFEYEIENHFGISAYSTPEEFQDLVVPHMTKHILIRTNENKIAKLKNGIVKLGHETSVTFEVMEIPSTFNGIIVTNSSFQTIPRNQSALIVLKKGFDKNQFKLDNNNNHTANLIVNNSKFEMVTAFVEASRFYQSLSMVLGGVLISTFLFIFYWRNRNRKVQTT